jgi:hypothetical protein
MDRSQTKGLRGRHGNKGKVALQPEGIGGTKVLQSPQGLHGAGVILRIQTGRSPDQGPRIAPIDEGDQTQVMDERRDQAF